MQVAEIVVRFGGSVLEVRHLATGTYRIGTARDVDLPVVGLTSFPLVDWTDRGCVIRIPAGMQARRTLDGAVLPLDGALTLTRGDRIVLAIGETELAVELATRVARVAKPSFDRTFPRWIAGALVAHLIALVAIDALAEPEAETVRAVTVMSLIAQLPDPPLPPTAPQKPRKAANKVATPKQVASISPVADAIELEPSTPKRRAVQRARRAGILGGGGFTAEQIRAITGTVDLEKALSDVGPIYDEVEAEGNRFGGGRRFDPTKREGWGTVETGTYKTVSNGRAVGDHYALPGEVAARPVPTVAHCVGSCTATGGLTRDAVRVAVARYDQAILGCYERGGKATRGDVVVELSIGEDGKVITADGAGLGTTGSCVAGVLRRVAFPKAAPTSVRYPLSFAPS